LKKPKGGAAQFFSIVALLTEGWASPRDSLPDASPILDDKGNLYGTTITGGAGGAGVAFEIMP